MCPLLLKAKQARLARAAGDEPAADLAQRRADELRRQPHPERLSEC